MKRGFTLVEVLVVIAVIVIILSIGAVSYTFYQKVAVEEQARGLAVTMKAAAERYYDRNNEYPISSVATGSSTDHIGPSTINYATVAQVFRVPSNTFNASEVKFILCHTNCVATANLNKTYVYYLTKSSNTDTATKNYAFPLSGGGTCTYTLPSPEVGGQAFLMVYWSTDENRWTAFRSNRGTVNSSNGLGSCPLKEL